MELVKDPMNVEPMDIDYCGETEKDSREDREIHISRKLDALQQGKSAKIFILRVVSLT